ncbi:TatD family hydrolase [Francisella hispaniensis]|uniref:DNAase n=1 Tax=Francisella hispaniensis FSC454 TaxID=1088883 RepID=A0AAC9NPL1_9GAMM|nr:TatD family hydrolase [Francisella hispaniensis]APD51193.1 DNAase [Francisella hispaniensis FSC454]KYW82908.1 DNAase [Francisella hispaniensis FSC454]
MILDAHVHTDKYSLEDLSKVAIECRTYNIKLLSVAMCVPSYISIKALSDKYDFIIPSFGIHPWKADIYAQDLISLDKYLFESKYIGEIGLDKKFLDYAASFRDQQQVFEYIVSHRAVDNKLLNLHTSEAELEVLQILERYKRHRFIVHWYAGDLEVLDKYLALGGHFSIGVEILFSEHIREITRRIPLERILTETDNPSSYSWLLGKEQNDGMPALLFKVIDKICEVKQIPKDIFLKILEENQKNILL